MRVRGALLVVFVALTAYANSVGNGLAYDDEGILAQNPTVTSGDWLGALGRSWWPEAAPGAGLYRPVTSASFALEWKLADGRPAAFHALNVLAHALVSLLVFALLLQFASPVAAAAGGALFALHPVHTEAVANVVGRAEQYAAAFYLTACLLYLKGRHWSGGRRVARLLGLGALYLLSLGSKEIGVTLPGALVLLELAASSREAGAAVRGEAAGGRDAFRAWLDGVWREAATWLLLAVVLLAYLGVRRLVLGSLTGEMEAPILQFIGPHARLLTAVAVWVQYLRLLVFPRDLVSDYDPAVTFPSEGLDLWVVSGVTIVALLAIVALRARREVPLVSLGIAFFAVAILPVSNLLFSTGTMLAERTLYLPSVGLSLVAAGLWDALAARPAPVRRAAAAAAALAAVALFVRTVVRNPAWLNTFVVVQTLSDEHPESWRAFRGRAQGYERVGATAEARTAWDQAVLLAPTDYVLLVQAADFHGRSGDSAVAESYLRRAVHLHPQLVNAYQHLATELLKRGQGREAHGVALEGLSRAGDDRQLWELVSEAYVGKGDIPAAIRAREAALAMGTAPPSSWNRMADLLDFTGDSARARDVRAHAAGAAPGS